MLLSLLVARVSKRTCRPTSLHLHITQSMPSKELEVALCYLRQVICSRSPQLISKSATALLDAISVHCDANDKRVQDALVRLLKSTDQMISQSNALSTDALMIAVAEISSAITDCSKPRSSHSDVPSFSSKTSENNPDAPKATISEADDPHLDELLKQLNIRQIPKFSPEFPDLGGDSDDDGVTTEEKKEERAEKHGQKLCEEEVQKMPDGREVRMKKTRTMNVSQSSKHVTISTRGGGCPSMTRKFVDGDRTGNEDEEEENTDFFSRDPFERMRSRNRLMDIESCSTDLSPAQSTKTKTLERTSEVSQSVSQKKEKNGRLLGEHAASKLDSTELKAKMIDTFQGETLLDRKGEGTYEESCSIQRGPPIEGVAGAVAGPPRKHVVEYMQTFGNEDNTDIDYFRGSTLSSYIQLNDNLKFHEEQFRKKLHFEFSSAGPSNVTLDFGNLAELLQTSDFGAIKLPTKWSHEEDEDFSTKAIDWQQRKAIQSVPETICVLDALEYLVMRVKDDCSKPSDVRGGPRDALIVYATQPTPHLMAPNFQEAFLVTYRTFISSNDLINKLVKRYLYMATSSDKPSQSAARHTFSVIVRVVDELNGVELQQDLIDSSTSFVYRLIRDGNFTFARILRKRLLSRIEDRSETRPNPTIAKYSSPRKNPSIFDFKSSDLAAQMTVIDAQLFQAIEPTELLWWAQEQDVHKSPNLVAFTENFNNVSFWVRSLVISQSSQKERERYMSKFIKVIKHLRRLYNFNSYLAVLSALLSSPLARLEWSSSISSQLKEHSEVMDTSSSYKNYRHLLSNAVPPCVPYIGVVLQDLTFIHVGNPSKIPAERCNGMKDIINFLKRWQQYAILESVRKLKRWNYDVQRDEKVIAFFDSFKNYLSEEKTWRRSHEIKPTNRRKV